MRSCCAPSGNRESNTTFGQRPKIAPRTVAATSMIAIPGGTFEMGNHAGDGNPDDGETPVHAVTVSPFLVDPCAVTNTRFAEFVNDTSFETEAERYGWSFVFEGLLQPDDRRQGMRVPGALWWCQVHAANWRHPEGQGSGIQDRLDHPVIHVSWNDALAFCQWSGSRLPTEAEWEFAARGGRAGQHFPWGNELNPRGKHMMNVWQGKFPLKNTGADGYLSTAPVTSYESNGFGLSNMTGNVWEWCADWFFRDVYHTNVALDPTGPVSGTARVTRGGSYLCHRSYCNRYRVDARSSNEPDSSTGNTGFRCARDL